MHTTEYNLQPFDMSKQRTETLLHRVYGDRNKETTLQITLVSNTVDAGDNIVLTLL